MNNAIRKPFRPKSGIDDLAGGVWRGIGLDAFRQNEFSLVRGVDEAVSPPA